MKRILLIIVLLGAPVAFANEVLNPGFESDLTDWIAKADRNMSQATAEAAHSGTRGLRVTDTHETQGSDVFSLPFGVEPGTKYELSCWGRGVDGSGAVGVYLRFLDENHKPINKPAVVSIPSDHREWKHYTLPVLAPPAAVSAEVWIHSFARDMPVVDLDDFEWTALPVQ